VTTIQNGGPYPALDRQVLRRVDRVIAVSQAVASDLAAAGVRPDRLICIPSGVAFDRLAQPAPGALRRQLGLSAETPLIGMIATLERKKAQDVLIAAMPRLLTALPAAHLVLIGADHAATSEVPGAYTAELHQLASNLQVDHRVHFLGFQPQAGRLMVDLDVAVLCSRREALGLAAVEALALGVPLVATAVEGLREVVTAGATGLLVPPDDPAALAGAIIDLLTDRARARQLAQRGRADVRERYDAGRLALRNLEVYQSLLSSRGAVGALKRSPRRA
jgi:glycosyltransferase involved in cell wall biosynthesis